MWGCLLGFGVAAKLNFKSRTLENEAFAASRALHTHSGCGTFQFRARVDHSHGCVRV